MTSLASWSGHSFANLGDSYFNSMSYSFESRLSLLGIIGKCTINRMHKSWYFNAVTIIWLSCILLWKKPLLCSSKNKFLYGLYYLPSVNKMQEHLSIWSLPHIADWEVLSLSFSCFFSLFPFFYFLLLFPFFFSFSFSFLFFSFFFILKPYYDNGGLTRSIHDFILYL